jgi:heptosyltransferase III
MQSRTKILLVRTDKIGDVVLTTPAISALRKKLPEAHLTGMTSTIAADVYKGNPHLDEVWVLDWSLYSGPLGFFRLVKKIRSGQFQSAVVFQTTYRLAFALLFAWVPVRIGPYSKWWSWLAFNRGRRQFRSAVEMHEAEYNIQLLKDFGISVSETRESTHLKVDEEARRRAVRFFAEQGLSPKHKTIAIHPGMAGSALNWPEGHYISLGRRLVRKFNVIVTGGPQEQALVERVFLGIAQRRSFSPNEPVFAKFVGETGLADLIALLDRCDGIVAASTGPMHLGVALGKKVVTVFSPIKVQSAVRWGPFGVSVGSGLGISPENRASVLVPDVNCGEDFRCALQACIYFPCMPRIAVEDVENQIVGMVEGTAFAAYRTPDFGTNEWDDPMEDLE